MSKIITISIDEDSLNKLDALVKKEYTDRSKIIRKWLNEHLDKNKVELEV